MGSLAIRNIEIYRLLSVLDPSPPFNLNEGLR